MNASSPLVLATSEADKATMKEVADTLKLTDDQKSKIKGYMEEYTKDRAAIRKDIFGEAKGAAAAVFPSYTTDADWHILGLAGLLGAWVRSLQWSPWPSGAVSAPLSLPAKFRFPAMETLVRREVIGALLILMTSP